MESWTQSTIDETCVLVNGGTPKTKVAEYWNGRHAWITPAEMSGRDSPYVTDTRRMLSEAGLAKSSATLLPPFSVIMSSRAPIGHLVINEIQMATNQGCKGLVPRKNLHHKFLYYYLYGIRKLLNDLGTGATFKELSATKLKQVPIPLPPLPEQERIVAMLDEAFAAIATATANAEKNLANAQELCETVSQSAIEGKLTFEKGQPSQLDLNVARHLNDDALPRIIDEEIPFPIPDGWSWRRLGTIVDLINGDRGKNYPNRKEYVSTGIPWINTGHIQHDGSLSAEQMNFISREKYDSLRGGKIRPGDLVYCLRGNTIGKTAFVAPYSEGAIASSLVIIRPGKQISSKFLFCFLRSRTGQSLIKRFDNGAAQPNLGAASVMKYVTPVPPSGVQRMIVEKVERLTGHCGQLAHQSHQRLTLLAELKQSILHKAFTGKLTVDTKAVDRELAEAGV